MNKNNIYTLDLTFQGIPGAIASYLIPLKEGAALVECGPGSTLPALQAGLRQHGYDEKDIRAVFLTHIHLDHAGAAGWLARQGAQIYVHPAGASHLINPEKLLASAQRIYGEQMHKLWGEFLPVPEEQLKILEDNEEVEIDQLHLRALETPGHANHHHAYLVDDTCFSGDIGGVRMQGSRFLSVPMPPPEFILEKWRASVTRLQIELARNSYRQIAPTHFGFFDDPGWHLDRLIKTLDVIEAWLEATLPGNLDNDQLFEKYLNWVKQRAQEEGMPPEQVEAYEAANPSFISVAGIQRYWRKFRQLEN